MKKALVVLGYIVSFWLIIGVALKTAETHERPDAVGIVMMLAGVAFILWDMIRPTEQQKQEEKKWKEHSAAIQAALSEHKKSVGEDHWMKHM